MASNQRKVELILGIRTTGATDATAGLDSISKMAESLKGELTALQRADALKDLGAVAAQVAAQTGQLDEAVSRLREELTAVGATEKEIRDVSKEFDRTTASIEKAAAAQAKLDERRLKDIEKVRAAQEKLGQQMADDIEAELRAQTKLNEQRRLAATGASTLQKELGQMARAEQIQKIGTEMGLLAKKTKDVSGTVAELNKRLKELGASEDEIRGAAGAFNAAQTNGTTNRLARAGAEIRNLPSTQIPGLGIGTDAIGNFLRLGGALAGVSEKTAETSKVAQLLTPYLGQTAAGFAGMVAAAAPVIAVLAAIALAAKNFAEATSQNVDEINAYAEAQRALSEKVAGGTTSQEALAEAERLDQRRKEEEKTLRELQAAYDAADKALLETDLIVRDVARAFSGDEQALADQIEASKKVIADTSAEYNSLTSAVEEGKFAANDAAEAEKRLAEERSKTALSAADNAAKELQAQQRALNATGEQNEKRLETIEDEKAVVEKQIEILEASGVASEEVTAKIAALKDQLGLLGKESEFINSTALEASKAADAEKQAQKDAEDAAKKAQQAQETYTKAVQSANTTFKQATEDAGIRLRYTLIDNAEKTNRDLAALDTKFAQDTYDLQLKSQRSERDAALDQIKDLEEIREDAKKEEQEALREGDFKALFLAREKAAEELKEDEQQFNQEALRRQIAANDALEDLKRNDQRQRDAKMLNYRYAEIDARNNQTRELQQAQLARQRNLQAASQALNAELALRGQFWNAVLGQAKNALNQVSGLQAKGANATSPFGSFQASFTTGLKGVMR